MARYRLAVFERAHLPELTDLWVAAWTKIMPTIDFEARRAWLVDHLGAMQARGVQITCAFDGQTVAGFITLDLEAGHIDQLAVAPAHWGQGAAETLLADAKRRARTLVLDVNDDNSRAIGFYDKHGFCRGASGVNPTSGLKTWRYEWSSAL